MKSVDFILIFMKYYQLSMNKSISVEFCIFSKDFNYTYWLYLSVILLKSVGFIIILIKYDQLSMIKSFFVEFLYFLRILIIFIGYI